MAPLTTKFSLDQNQVEFTIYKNIFSPKNINNNDISTQLVFTMSALNGEARPI